MAVKHTFVSAIADGGDATLVQPSNWNASHTVDDNTFVAAKLSASATDVVFGRSTAAAGAGEEIVCTAAGRALIDDAAASNQRTTLGLGTIATQDANNVSISGGSISGITDLPVADGGTGASTAQLATKNLAACFVLAKSGLAVSCPADITEDTLATITVPANAMGANGWLRITTFWTTTSSGNLKTMFIRFSGTGGTAYLNFGLASIGNPEYFDVRMICNANATNAQIGTPPAAGNLGSGVGWGAGPTAAVTSAVDTTAQTTIVIRGQKAVAGETLTLKSYLVELMSDGT